MSPRPDASGGRPGVVLLSAVDDEDREHLRALEEAPDRTAVLCLVPADVEPPAETQAAWHRLAGRPEMHGFRIRGNVEVTTLTEGLRMTLAPDAPLPDPDVEPVEPTDPDDVPEVPLEPTPAPEETGIR